MATRYSAFGRTCAEPEAEPEPELKADLSAVPDAMWRAAGIDPACMPKSAKPIPVTRNRTQDLEQDERLLDCEWYGPVADLCATWKQNHISRRSHRESLDDFLWLARHRLGWAYVSPDRDSPFALRQRAASWGRSRRFHALLEVAEAAGVWRQSSLAALRSIVLWADRVASRVEAKRAAVRSQARRRAATT